ncbi:peptidase s41 family protein [Fusarium austroafricanum]|uniref:Peptidase s41 family protein n=1 Tax=Fusarium austroafricanum TaxID=2364996 RepID=A0A8H4KBF6_9HYPO|nr:peptidase s41 family protein [Fusarium austroafricanum]
MRTRNIHHGAALLAAAAVSSSFPSTAASPAASNPCRRVSESWAAQIGSGVETPMVDAALAYKCVTSVPIAQEQALKFIDELVPYLEWQSDQAWKKNPPMSYTYPGYDMWAELATIRAGIELGKYKTEYDWQNDLFIRVFGPGHDGHMYIFPDLLDVFRWQRQAALVSISEDGLKLPVIKVYQDVISSPKDASVVTHINGKDAVTYIEDFVNQVGENQDRDANYNMMFYSRAQAAVYKTLGHYHRGGRPQFVYPGETTTLTFQNGSVVEMRNSAQVTGNWTGVVDSKTFFAKLCPNALPGSGKPAANLNSKEKPGPTGEEARLMSSADEPRLPGYPKPVAITSDKSASGYFLEEPGFEDVAVIVLTSMSVSAASSQKTVQDFYAAAKRAGKNKLVVDVQVNEGGFIAYAYDMFRQLFPDIVQDVLGRRRLSPGFAATAKGTSEICHNFDPVATEEEDDEDKMFLCQSPFYYGYDLDSTLHKFKTHAQKYTPYDLNSDKFTNLTAWDLADITDTSSPKYGWGFNVTGYGNLLNFTRPFSRPDDIVMLLDGYCSSSCTIFAQCMVHDAGVKTISIGGRPRKGPMQGVGGVKGSHVYGHTDIQRYTGIVKGRLKSNNSAIVKELERYTNYIPSRTRWMSVNMLDSYLPGSRDSGPPSQFVTENSHCRMFWTQDMVDSPAAVWKAAAKAAFKGGKCAAGGFDKRA